MYRMYDSIKMKDGRIGDVMDDKDPNSLTVDVMISKDEWETLYDVKPEEIERKFTKKEDMEFLKSLGYTYTI